MSFSRHPSSSPRDESTVTRNTPDPDATDRRSASQATGQVTGHDGTVLATVSRHTEDPANPDQAPLAVVEMAGDIDAETAPLLYSVLSHAIRGNRRVCCDLSQAGFLGADAVNTIFAALGDADDAGCVLTVRGVHGFGVRVFQITGLEEFLASRA